MPKFSLAGFHAWKSSWSTRFYLRIYFAILGSMALANVATVAIMWSLIVGTGHTNERVMELTALLKDALPNQAANKDELLAGLNKFKSWTDKDGTLYAADGSLLVSTLPDAPARVPPNIRTGWYTGLPGTLAIPLPEKKWLILHRGFEMYIPSTEQIIGSLLIAIVVGLGSYPLITRLIKRLERLQSGVDAFGDQDLSTRVKVEGDDEIARLATSFNRSAAKIEALVTAQKSLLANASHELRSPLTRIRLAIELMSADAQPAIRQELQSNIGELDQLIDEILLSSRLEASRETPLEAEELDLTALLAEECARVNADLQVDMENDIAPQASMAQGDSRLLRRLLRNLLENARRYGDGKLIEVKLLYADGYTQIDICDRGSGIPEGHRERIFEPFYRLPGASESNGGVGLGLSLVKQIAERHAGEVRCLSRLGGGSCFRLRLPDAVMQIS